MRKISIIMLLAFLPIFAIGQQRYSVVLAAFSSLEVSSDLNINYAQSPEFDINVEGPDDAKRGIQIDIDKKGVLRFIVDKSVSLKEIKVFIKAPLLENITLGKASTMTFDTDIDASKAKVSITLTDDAEINAKKISAKQLNVSLRNNSIFKSNATAKGMNIDARGKSKLNFSGDVGAMKLSARDNAQISIEKLKGKSLSANAAGSSAINVSFDGKSGSASSSGSATIQLVGKAGKAALEAEDNSSIDIRKLTCKSVKTATKKAGVIVR